MMATQLSLQFDKPPPFTFIKEEEPTRQPTPVPIASGEKAKARDIIAAIRTLKTIEQEQRPATEAEKSVVARFGGFGPVALSIFPDPVTGTYKEGWQALGEELKTLLTPAEYDSAKRTTFNAFYTSPAVIAAMHDAIARLGVPENATVLEPGCGTGNFMTHGKPGSRFIGIELDAISGRIARALHPEHDIRIENFRDTHLPENRIDAVIGNVPFADVKLDYHGQKFSLHDYFFAKSIDALKPGGVLALVTSHFTLDKQNAAIREYLASKADFVGAIRLPSDAFKREGTAVVTDIVFLRKRARNETPATPIPTGWASHRLRSMAQRFPINRYFLNHPEMVLGNWTRKDTLYWRRLQRHRQRRPRRTTTGSRQSLTTICAHSAGAGAETRIRTRVHPAATRAAHQRRQFLRRRRSRRSASPKAGKACRSSMAARHSNPTAR